MSNARAALRRAARSNERDVRDAGRLASALSANRMHEAAAVLRRRPDLVAELAQAHKAADAEAAGAAAGVCVDVACPPVEEIVLGRMRSLNGLPLPAPPAVE